MALEKDSSSFYEVLGVTKDSSTAEIRSAYKKLARKWHPDKSSGNPSKIEQAKLKFQQIQEAYSVLSDDTKRALYDAGLYDSCEDGDGFSDFLDEMASMMANVRAQGNKEESFEELQQMFMKMVGDDWFSVDNFQQSEPVSQEAESSQPPKPSWEMDELNEEMEDEWWEDSEFNLISNEDDLYSAIETHQSIEGKGDGVGSKRHKKPRICNCDTCKEGIGIGGGFQIHSCGAIPDLNSYASVTSVA